MPQEFTIPRSVIATNKTPNIAILSESRLKYCTQGVYAVLKEKNNNKCFSKEEKFKFDNEESASEIDIKIYDVEHFRLERSGDNINNKS